MSGVKKYCFLSAIALLLVIFLFWHYMKYCCGENLETKEEIIDLKGNDESSDSGQWIINDIYGQWKASRLIYRSQGSYGDVPLGNEIGRTFTISEDQIIDSRSEEMCTLIGQRSCNMVCTSIEEKEYADHTDFREEGGIPLKAAGRSAGIPDGKIKTFTFWEMSGHTIINGLSAFTYDY